jgi:hypothetical protein
VHLFPLAVAPKQPIGVTSGDAEGYTPTATQAILPAIGRARVMCRIIPVNDQLSALSAV